MPRDLDELGLPWRLAWIRVSDLTLDTESYQRAINQAHLAHLARTFRPNGLFIIAVSNRGRGLFVVIDGQHRVLTLRVRGLNRRKIPCAVVDDLTLEKERELFLLLNRGHLPLGAYHHFQTRVHDQRDVSAGVIATACAAVGLELIAPGHHPGVRQTGALEYLQDLDARGVLTPVLETLNAAWGEEPGAFKEGYLKLTTRLLDRHSPNVLIPVLRELPPRELERQVVDYLRTPRATIADYARVIEQRLGDMSRE